MAGIFSDCRELFETDDLYEVLGIKKASSEKEVKRAYHRLSLKVHPDRVSEEDKEICTKKFQALGKIYTVLSNQEARKVYDETGEVDEENNLQEDKDWYQYWRLLFAKISVSDIKEFEKKYKGSEEEKEDLKAAYVQCKGDMDTILDNVMCSSIEDEPRFREMLMEMIEDGDVKAYKAFQKKDEKKQKQRQQKAKAEAAEAEELQKEMGLGEGEDDLKQMILKNRQSRESQANDFFAQLEAKYADKPKAKKSKKK